MSFTLRLVKGSALTWAEFDNNLSEIETKWLEIVTISGNALAAANFVGQWSSLTGSLSIPAATYWSGKFWMLLADVVDVTAHEPGVSASWAELVAGNVLGPVSATAGNVAILDATGKVLSDGGVAPAALMPKAGGVFTGDVTVPSLNSGQLAGLRNKVINGSCEVAQRGNVAAVLGVWTYGGADRIAVLPLSFSTATGTIAAITGLASPGRNQSVLLTTTGSGAVNFETRLESRDVIDLNSKTVTFSVRVYQDTGSAINTGLTITKANAVDNFTAGKTILGTSTPVSVASGTATYLTFTLALGATDASNGLSCQINFTGVGAITSKSFVVGELQLEVGSVATPFEHRPYGMELALAQRYYIRQTPTAADQTLGVGHNTSTTAAVATTTFPVQMRSAPTALEQSGTAGDYSVAHAATSTVCSAVPTFLTASPFAATTTFTVASGLTAGQGSRARAVNTSAYLAWSAEL